MPERTLLKIGRDLQEKVKGISAVLEANIGGDRDEQVEIVIDPLLLDSYGLDPRQGTGCHRSIEPSYSRRIPGWREGQFRRQSSGSSREREQHPRHAAQIEWGLSSSPFAT